MPKEIINKLISPTEDDHQCRYREALDTAHKVFAAECDAMHKQSTAPANALGSPVRYTDGTISREYDEQPEPAKRTEGGEDDILKNIENDLRRVRGIGAICRPRIMEVIREHLLKYTNLRVCIDQEPKY